MYAIVFFKLRIQTSPITFVSNLIDPMFTFQTNIQVDEVPNTEIKD